MLHKMLELNPLKRIMIFDLLKQLIENDLAYSNN